MKSSIAFWIVSLVVTLATAYYQRITGPTYPLSGTFVLDGIASEYQLVRSHGGEGDARVSIPAADPAVHGTLQWKRFKTRDEWRDVPMENIGGERIADLPHQPPAGKLEYHILLDKGEVRTRIPETGNVVIRFKGDVPAGALIPHVIAMFAAMLISNRAGIEALRAVPKLNMLTLWTLGLMTLGGMILGPVVQKYAFGEYWTGIPFGMDLTDNKTLIAFVAWLAAALRLRRSKKPALWVLAASVITLVIFLIPHSLFGSELQYEEIQQ